MHVFNAKGCVLCCRADFVHGEIAKSACLCVFPGGVGFATHFVVSFYFLRVTMSPTSLETSPNH